MYIRRIRFTYVYVKMKSLKILIRKRGVKIFKKVEGRLAISLVGILCCVCHLWGNIERQNPLTLMPEVEIKRNYTQSW